jgi:hypothetical protein
VLNNSETNSDLSSIGARSVGNEPHGGRKGTEVAMAEFLLHGDEVGRESYLMCKIGLSRLR